LDRAAGKAAAIEIFARHPASTAIFASTFAMGMGVLLAAREAGVRIPADLSVIALHDSELADYFSPPLSTVRLPVGEMASEAVDLLLALIDGAAPQSIVAKTPPRLTLRASTAPPRTVKRLTKSNRSA
jgi:LacI family transcriptional regulator